MRSSKEGTLYLLHDPLLLRTTNFKGRLSKYHDKELRHCRLENGEPLPKLGKLLRLLSRSGVKHIFLEYKERGREKDILSMISRYGLKRRTIITQFNHRSLHSFRLLDRTVKLYYERDILRMKHLRVAKSLGCVAVGTRLITTRRSIVAKAHRLSMKVFLFPIKKQSHLKKALSLGVDGVFANRIF